MKLWTWTCGLVCLATVVQSHDAEHACPICNMDVVDDITGKDLGYYVQLAYGQRLYTCGMIEGTSRSPSDRRLQSLSHPAHLATAMAKYIVPHCADAATRIPGTRRDPVSGHVVTSSAAFRLCFKFGTQQLWFASNETLTQYRHAVMSIPYYVVTDVQCAFRQCRDAFELPHSEPKHDPLDTTATATTISLSSSTFCHGASAMFNGFDTAVGGTCVVLLTEILTLDTPVLYVLGFFFTVFLAMSNEWLVRTRESVRRRFVAQPLASARLTKLILAGLYMAQMTLAYFLMLIVMTYDVGLFFALIVGFGIGFVVFKDWDGNFANMPRPKLTRKASSRIVQDLIHYPRDALVLQVEGMYCMKNCGLTIERALMQKVQGILLAKVVFSDRQVIITGKVSMSECMDVIEEVGFHATPLQD